MSDVPVPVRILLRLFPEDFRRLHASGLVRDYQGSGTRGGWLRRAWYWTRVSWDLCGALAGVWWDRWTSAGGGPRRDQGTTKGNTMDNLLSDLRLAVRGLARAPGFTVMAVATIALGLGANAAIFSVVNGVLLRPLPYADSDELVRVWGRFLPESGFDFLYFSIDPTEYLDVRDDSRAFEEVAAYGFTNLTLSGLDATAERLRGLSTTWNLFDLLGVTAASGRTLIASDDVQDGPDVAVLSHEYWETRFGSDPSVVGSTVDLNREAYEVVGVLPPGFSFPTPGVDVYVPLQLGDNPSNRQSHYLSVVARRADGVTFEAAVADLERMMGGWVTEYPDIHTGHFLFLEGFKEAIVRTVRPALLLLLGAVGFVLLVACANVANLLLVRGHARTTEVAVRSALGASRGRILQFFLVESAVLTLLGGALGVALATVGVPLLLRLDEGAVPLAHAVSMDGSVLAFTVLLTLLTALVFGLVPAAQAGDRAIGALREDARAGSGTRRRVRVRNLLVAAEVALSFMLVIGAGLMIRSVGNLLSEDPGFDSDRRLVASFSLPPAAYPAAEDAARFLDEVVERAEALPGVTAATHVAHLPMRGGRSVIDFELEGMAEPGPGQPAWNAGFTVVRSNYFEVMGIDVSRGRGFDRSVDRPDGEMAAVVSQSFADRFLAGRDPIGQRMRFSGSSPERPWWTIIGVVDDVRQLGLGSDVTPTYYLDTAQLGLVDLGGYARFGSLVLHVGHDRPLELAEPIRRVVLGVDPDVPLTGLATMDAVVSESVASSRFLMTLLSLFAAVALALGAVGIYGVTSFVVSQRSHEIGVHKALGAGGGEVVSLIVRQGLAPVGLGVLLGLAGAVTTGRVLSSLLYGVEPSDAVTYGAVLVVLGSVALAALWLPARRAARLDPMVALRSD